MNKYTKIVPAMTVLALLGTYTLATAQEDLELPPAPKMAPRIMQVENTQLREVSTQEVQDRANELKEKREVKIENVKENLEERKGEEAKITMEQRKAQWTEKRNATVVNYSDRMHTRLEAALTRLEQINTRIEARIGKLTQMDTGEALVYLETAAADMTQLRTRLQESKDSLEGVLMSEDPKGNFTQAREQVKTMAGEIREIHTTMTKAVASLRAQVEEEVVEEEMEDEEVVEEPEV